MKIRQHRERKSRHIAKDYNELYTLIKAGITDSNYSVILEKEQAEKVAYAELNRKKRNLRQAIIRVT